MGLFDRFRDPQKVRLEQEAREAARIDEEARRRDREIAEQIRQEEALARSEWRYRETVDEMRGAKTRFAELTSENSVDLLFPYEGGSTTIICIRKNPDRTREALILTVNGQYDRDLSGYNFAMKIDSGRVSNWSANSAADGRANVMFVNNSVAFIAAVANAERVILELPFYNNGRHQFFFNAQGMDKSFK